MVSGFEGQVTETMTGDLESVNRSFRNPCNTNPAFSTDGRGYYGWSWLHKRSTQQSTSAEYSDQEESMSDFRGIHTDFALPL